MTFRLTDTDTLTASRGARGVAAGATTGAASGGSFAVPPIY